MNSKNKILSFLKKFLCLALAVIVMSSAYGPSLQAKSYITPKSDLPQNTDAKVVKVTLKNRKGPLTFIIQAQSGFGIRVKSFIHQHGCAVSALTTVLRAYNKKYANVSRQYVYKKLEKRVFGKKKWSANYSKSSGSQRPVSLYGISKVLKKCGVKNKYIRSFSNKKAVKKIEKHLKKGNVVIIETNNHKQDDGDFHKKYTSRWAGSKHTMVLLGMTDNGMVIVADSAYRPWSGPDQRIKYARMEQLVRYMIPCKKHSKNCYFRSISDSGGYILVNP